jgi:hypothetical protein
MEKTAEKKSYASDTRKYRDAVLADGIHKLFTDSPVTDALVMKDMCYRGVGFLGQHGKETKTSWDTLSYTLIQSHNVWMHMNAVQEANRQYEQGVVPKMLVHKFEGDRFFTTLVDEIFSKKTKQESLDLIDYHSSYWTQFQSGSQGISGKKTVNTMSTLSEWEKLFTVEKQPIEEIEDSDDVMIKVLAE